MTTAQIFDQIAQEHGPMIKRIAASYEARPHLAEELVQEIYFAIWRALPSFRGDARAAHFPRQLVIPEIRLDDWIAGADVHRAQLR